jgi:proline dehydrogenase
MGSHNEQSALLAIELLEKYSVSLSDHRFWFSQLLGMCDHISFALAKRGYNVVKFVPFGPMNKLVPYLARRAEENSSITGQTIRELIRLKKELERRKKEAKTS